MINGEITGYTKKYRLKRGLEFEGEYKNGKKNGKGKEYYTNGNIKFDGIYKEDMKWTGKGYNINGNLEYEIKDGNGKFKEFYEDGILEFEGEIVKGKRSGYGKCWHGDQITFEGFF